MRPAAMRLASTAGFTSACRTLNDEKEEQRLLTQSIESPDEGDRQAARSAIAHRHGSSASGR